MNRKKQNETEAILILSSWFPKEGGVTGEVWGGWRVAGSRLPGEENGSPEGSEAWKGQMLGGHCAPGPLAGALGAPV